MIFTVHKAVLERMARRCGVLLFLLASVWYSRASDTLPRPEHVVIVIEENHGFAEIIGSASAPYINSLAQQGVLFTNSFAIEHPSQPNYLDLFSGSNQGSHDDVTPAARYTTPNLGAELIAAGRSFAGFSEDLPSTGFQGATSGQYARKHAPWTNWQDSSANSIPASDNAAFTAFPSDYSKLPTLSFVIPNQDHDMHDGSIAQGDAWLMQNLDGYVQWARTHNSLLIVTFDEDDFVGTNQVATIFCGPMVAPGTSAARIDHFNVLRTLEDMYGLEYAGAAAASTPILNVWMPPITFAKPAAAAPNPAVVGQTIALSASATGGIGALNYSWDFADGSPAISGAEVTHAYLNAGSYAATVSVSDTSGASKTQSVNAQIFSLPAWGSAAVALPNPAGVGQTVAFNSAAQNGFGTLNYTWNFGDASPVFPGANAMHAYTAAGTYTAIVTVTDALQNGLTGAVTVIVVAPFVGEGNDSDGDGFSDAFENAVGTDPNDAASTPTGGAFNAGAIQVLTISRASITLDFLMAGNDRIVFKGTLPGAPKHKLDGTTMYFDVGGVVKAVTFSERRSGASRPDMVRIARLNYKVAFKNGSFREFLAPLGLTDSNVQGQVMVPFTFILDGTVLQTVLTMKYRAEMGKKGWATEQRR